jgi:hypothetical protein
MFRAIRQEGHKGFKKFAAVEMYIFIRVIEVTSYLKQRAKRNSLNVQRSLCLYAFNVIKFGGVL